MTLTVNQIRDHFFDNEKYPGFFACIVPESDRTARIGTASITPNNGFGFLKKVQLNEMAFERNYLSKKLKYETCIFSPLPPWTLCA